MKICPQRDEQPPLVFKTMNPPIANPSASERPRITAPVFNVAILYESSDAGTRAKQFSDQLVNGVAANRVLGLNQWDFRFLVWRAIRNAAASDAAAADLVILSMSGESPLPAQVERWIAMWTWLIDGGKPAVVALFATHHPESHRIGAFLRRSTASKGLTFFPQTACSMMDKGHAEALLASGQTFGANRQQITQIVQ